MSATDKTSYRDQVATDHIARAWELVEAGFPNSPREKCEEGCSPRRAAIIHLQAAIESLELVESRTKGPRERQWARLGKKESGE
jgi:hypothetical protein